jgi:hypothetical protein
MLFASTSERLSLTLTQGSDRLSAPAFGVGCELHECIAIVDLDIEQAEQPKSEEAGNFRAFRVAEARSVKGPIT